VDLTASPEKGARATGPEAHLIPPVKAFMPIGFDQAAIISPIGKPKKTGELPKFLVLEDTRSIAIVALRQLKRYGEVY
jgi:hypothetical protein